MVFDFIGDKTKVVIAMAHIGALPGAPLYDPDGGVAKLIEGVITDIDKLCRRAASMRSCSATRTIAPTSSRRRPRAWRR